MHHAESNRLDELTDELVSSIEEMAGAVVYESQERDPIWPNVYNDARSRLRAAVVTILKEIAYSMEQVHGSGEDGQPPEAAG